jgi:FtsP/CotA-like multicopper oxidase with cupredoxin domain
MSALTKGTTAMKKRQLNFAWRLLVAASLFSVAGTAAAVTFDLVAEPFPKTMADGSTVTMWGYRLASETVATVPGPTLRVPAGDSLTIRVTNSLPQTISLPGTTGTPTSLVVPGQRAASAPAMFNDASGRSRVRSFAPEAAAGQTVTYTWSSPQPGTYLYHSGTQPQVQVQMGLYGAVIVEAGSGIAYPGVDYAAEVTLLYSEIDPALHAAVASGTYGNPAGANPMTSTLHYLPKYFLVNGESYTPGVTLPIATAAAGSRTLLRLLNAGLDTHVPLLQGLDMSIVAEDGKPYTYAKTQYTAPLAPLKTLDAVIVPPVDGNYPIYDRRLALANNAVAPGGMLRILRTGGAPIAPPTNHPPVANPDEVTTAAGTAVVVNVLANDTDPDGNPLRLIAVSNPSAAAPLGVPNVAITGMSVTYTPPAELASGATDTFNYVICDNLDALCTNGLLGAGTVTVTIQ